MHRCKFFFNYFYAKLKENKNLKYFFTEDLSKYEDLSAEQKSKIKRKNAAIFKKLGYSYIYMRLLELNCFNDNKRTPMECIYEAPFTEALLIISLNNLNQQ